ncbi:UNVERIFIED_CONTAM: hypothetical protein RMT77_015243 [Armadillidium vulgare]
MNNEGENKIENDATDFSTETKTSPFTKSEELKNRETNFVNVFVKEEYIENEEPYICDTPERNDMLQVGKFSPNTDVKDEFVLKEESIDVKEEIDNDQLIENVSVIDENQKLNSEDNAVELPDRNEGEGKVFLNDEKMFSCNLCDYKAYNKNSLKYHSLSHLDKYFKCCDCDYASTRKADLKKHLLTHSKTRLFKCSNCNYSTNKKGNLSRHSVTHFGKYYNCSQCCYTCHYKDQIKDHLLTHTDKLHKCPECEYASNIKRSVSQHMLVHNKQPKRTNLEMKKQEEEHKIQLEEKV